MPSDEAVRRAAEALTGPIEAYRSAVVATVDQLRALLDEGDGTDVDTSRRRAAASLGAFGAGRIDVDRFASLTRARAEPAPVEGEGRRVMRRALETLESLLGRGEDLYRVRLETGADLLPAVGNALAEAGRAFGASRAAQAVRAGTWRAERHDGWLARFPAELWDRRERELAPPLLVELDGGDLRAGGLERYLDGTQKLVLLVSGATAPAALVRCITPGVHVLQTTDPTALGRVGDFEGPAIAALVPEEAARFEHRPGERMALRDRLVVEHLPEPPRGALASRSAFQLREELRLLAELSEGRAPGPAAAGALAAADGAKGPAAAARPATKAEDTDLLAAWILKQADLDVDQGR